MIEKLIQDAKDWMSKSKEAGNEAQQAYENLVADTNASVDELAKAVAAQTGAVAGQVGNLDFQKTMSDQTVTVEVLHEAMESLASVLRRR